MKSNKLIFIIPFLSVIMTLLFSYTTSRWKYIKPESTPSPRAYAAIAYDSESDKIIMFSGQEGQLPPVKPLMLHIMVLHLFGCKIK